MDVTALMMNALVLLLPACVQNGISDKTAPTFPRIVPSKLQLFEHTGLNVTCEGFFNRFTKWRVMRSVMWSVKTAKRTLCNKSFLKFGACHILVSYSADSGEYWCETEDEERSEKVTITVTAGEVILEIPVRPVTVGDTVVLRCIGKNNSHHRADFYKDGRHVNTSPTGEMTIHSVSVSDSGRYSCSISKDERSAENFLRVRPVLLESPSQPVMKGEDVTLFCRDKTTSSNFTSYFYKNGHVVGNSSRGNLTLFAVSKLDEGLYRCKVTDTGESEENWLAVQGDSVVTQLRFVQTGTDVTLDIMDPAVLEGFLLLQWKYNNTKVLVKVQSKGEATVNSERVVYHPQNYSVTLKNLQKADSGLYEAQLIKTNEQPIISKFLLTVKDPVSPVKLTVDSVSKGSESCTFNVSCRTADVHMGHSFICNNQICDDKQRYTETTPSAASLHLSLTEDSIICKHSNEVSWTQDMTDIQQVCPTTTATFPRLVPSKLQLFEHTGLNVTCEGFFNRFTKWRVMRSVKTVNRAMCNKSFLKFGACHIPVSYSSDSGEYWCETEDEEKSEKVTITVTAGEVILESPVRPVTVEDTVVLHCIGKNNSHHRADFYKDGRHINTSLTGEMTIHSVSVSDSGRYSCNISKDESSAENFLQVRHPVSPVTLTVDSVSKGSESCNFTVSCRTEDVHMGHSFTCNNQICDDKQRYTKTTPSAASLHLYLSNVSIICNHSNEINWSQDMTDIQQVCPRTTDSEEVSAGVSVCLVTSAVFSVGLVVMVSAVVSVHVLDCIKKKK